MVDELHRRRISTFLVALAQARWPTFTKPYGRPSNWRIPLPWAGECFFVLHMWCPKQDLRPLHIDRTLVSAPLAPNISVGALTYIDPVHGHFVHHDNE